MVSVRELLLRCIFFSNNLKKYDDEYNKYSLSSFSSRLDSKQRLEVKENFNLCRVHSAHIHYIPFVDSCLIDYKGSLI